MPAKMPNQTLTRKDVVKALIGVGIAAGLVLYQLTDSPTRLPLIGGGTFWLCLLIAAKVRWSSTFVSADYKRFIFTCIDLLFLAFAFHANFSAKAIIGVKPDVLIWIYGALSILWLVSIGQLRPHIILEGLCFQYAIGTALIRLGFSQGLPQSVEWLIICTLFFLARVSRWVSGKFSLATIYKDPLAIFGISGMTYFAARLSPNSSCAWALIVTALLLAAWGFSALRAAEIE